jgi:hypothetical protein
MYAEFAHDPKVQMLTEAMQRRYMMLMCMRCSNALVTLHETEIAFHLRITEPELDETKALFVAKGFIDAQWNLLNWEKRQFKSDTSNARVAKHRALQKEKHPEPGNADVTLPKRKANALDTDTDTDKKTSSSPAVTDLFDRFWGAYPRKVGKDAARKAFAKRKVTAPVLARMLEAIAEQRNTTQWIRDAGQFIPHPSTWLNEGRWQDEAANASWQSQGVAL